MKRHVRGLPSFDRMHIQNMQADLGSMIEKLAPTMINANFITKAKNAFAQAFAPSFAPALA